MTPKQERFVEEYMKDCNGTQAYKRAGYSASNDNVAKVEASKLLTKPNVARAIEEKRLALSEKCQVDAEYVLNGLQEVVQRSLNRQRVMKFDPVERCMVGVTDDDGNPVYTYDSQGANRALELLGKHLGLFSDKITGDIAIRVVREDRALDGNSGGE